MTPRHTAPKRGTRRRSGSALIVTLWVIGLLSILIGSFAFDAQVEARITSYYRKRTKAEALAQSGVTVAEMLMAKSAEMGEEDEPEDDDRWFDAARALKDGALMGWKEPLGEGTITLDIVPEPARRNINNLDLARNTNIPELEKHLERILEVGDITWEMWPDYIDPFIDWIDKNDEPRNSSEAAESDYYESLPEPYSAKNGPLDTVEELLLVRNFDRIVLYGGVIETGFEGEEPIRISGIEDLLTTYGDGKVNVNAASARVLRTLPDIDETIAQEIIDQREGLLDENAGASGDPFKNPTDFVQRMGLPESLKKFITTDSKIYRVTSTGTVYGVRREIWCIVNFNGKKLRVLRWREEA